MLASKHWYSTGDGTSPKTGTSTNLSTGTGINPSICGAKLFNVELLYENR